MKAASELLGVSEKTLRRWDRTGALPADRDPSNNYRVYDERRLRAWLAGERPRGPLGPEDPVGQAPMLAAIDAELARGERLIVIVGPPGVGKTRLLRAWRDRAEARVIGYAAVGACRTAEELAIAIGAAIGATARSATSEALAESIHARLREAPASVLLLDEIENLDEAGTRLLGLLAEDAAALVVTSRVRPRLTRERVLVVPPLAFPLTNDPDAARASDAVTMFLGRARRAGALEEVDDDVLREAASIVRRLEGLPLALELAASRAATVGLARLRRELDASLDAMGSSPIDAPPHHRTLEHAVSVSIARLDARRRALLEVASLLPHEFEIEELEGLAGGPASDTLESLQALVDHSMISVRRGAASTTRTFGIHAVVRELVLARASVARRAALDAMHVAWRVQEARRLAEDRSTAAARRIARDETALQRAWAWSVERLDSPSSASNAADLASALGRLVETFGPSPTLVAILDRTAALAEAGGVPRGRRAEILFYAALSRLAQSQLDEARVLYGRALTLADGTNPRFEALTHAQLAWLASRDGDQEEAERALDRASRATAGRSDPAPDMIIASLRGQFDLRRGRLASARRFFELARSLAVRVGDGGNEASASGFLGSVAHDSGALREAVRHYDRAIATAGAQHASIMEAIFRGYRAMTLHELGEVAAEEAYDEAIELLDRAHALRFLSLFRAWRAAWLAQRGRLEEATRAMDDADVLLDEVGITAISLLRGHLDLASADAARADGDEVEAHRREAMATWRLATSGADRDEALRELKLPYVFLERSLKSRAQGALPADLIVGWQGRWLTLHGARIALQRHRALGRLVWELALRRVIEPGVEATPASLVAALWPGERLKDDAARHRLRVGLSTLRRLGLREAIELGVIGYRLSPALTVRIDRREADQSSAPASQ